MLTLVYVASIHAYIKVGCGQVRSTVSMQGGGIGGVVVVWRENIGASGVM